MRLKSFDFLLFANLPNWHEEWCMLWWLPSSIQFFEGECNAFTFYNFYFDGWEGKKSPSFCRKNYKWGFTDFASTRKIPKKFNAISAHELFDLKVTVEVKWDFLISIQVKPSSSEFELCENCVKIIKNIAFEFLNFGIFHQFLSFTNWPVW